VGVPVRVMGWGNPAREDDGLGPAAIAALGSLVPPGVELDSDYHLHPEDACDVAGSDCVVFVDAAVEGPEPYAFAEIHPDGGPGFTSHGLRPEALLALTEQCFGRRVPAWMLAIRGYSFEPFRESLTEGAERNLDAAVRFLAGWLAHPAP
jgi:hydrogenase maturation protease